MSHIIIRNVHKAICQRPCQCAVNRGEGYHVSVVGVEGLIDERELIRTQPLLIIDQLGKLEGKSSKCEYAAYTYMDTIHEVIIMSGFLYSIDMFCNCKPE